MKYYRATVADIAEAANCSRHVVRVLADKGFIDSTRDYNGWRLFPDMEKAVDQVKKNLDLKMDPKKRTFSIFSG